MKLERKKYSVSHMMFQVLFIFAWLTNLKETDSFHNVYVLCAILGIFCLYDNHQKQAERFAGRRRGAAILACVFSLATVVANYPLFKPLSVLLNLFNAGCALLGGFFLGYHVLICAAHRLPLELAPGEEVDKRTHPVRLYLICFGTIATVFLMYLFCVAYPGYLASDSLNSLAQIQSGVYLNNNPFWYTKFIELCMDIGNALFHDINAAVAVYSAAQILIMAACFAYGVVTLYQAGMPKWSIAVCFGVYMLLPYNITYSVTMWKDTLFSGAALLIVASSYRLLKGIGTSRVLNYAVAVIGGIGFCLMRTNGWYSYLVMTLIMLVMFFKEHKDILKLMLIILLVCWILINPVLDMLGVGETDFVEVLSVPMQQISRVIANEGEISDSDLAFLGEIFRLERIPTLYSPEIVDPIKLDAIRTAGRAFLSENFGEFIKVWIRLGIQNPGEYLEAWVELTKGFWNGGYYFWIYLAYSYPETSGIGGFEMDNLGKDIFDLLFRFTEKPVVLQPFYSIGLHAWMIVVCCYVCAVKKRKELLLTLPILVLLVGLWVGTPVYAEFRYAYPMFTTCPLILLATIFDAGTPEKKAWETISVCS